MAPPRLCWLSLTAALLASCDSAEPPPPTTTAPPQTALSITPALFIEEGQPLRLLADDAPLDLWNAPQGGHVVLIGAQIEGMSGDTVEMKARLRDAATNDIVAEEGRTVVLTPVDGDPTTKQPDLRTRSQVCHVPLCPNYDERGLVGVPHVLEIEVTELYVEPIRRGKARVTVVPRCALGDAAKDARCSCECGAGYTLGKCK